VHVQTDNRLAVAGQRERLAASAITDPIAGVFIVGIEAAVVLIFMKTSWMAFT
jgi:hypothetical protein